MWMSEKFFTEDQIKLEDIPKRLNFSDLTGNEVGKIKVIGFAGYIGEERKLPFWWCECSCTKGRYFKVVSQSLKRGITRSCGCNRRNNRNRPPDTKETANTLLKDHLEFKDYSGWNHPCSIHCSLCDKVTDFSKANNARGFKCCSIKESTTDINLRKYNYERVDSVARCLDCGLEQQDFRCIKDFCGCKYLNTGGESIPCAVYFLQESNNPWIKIGKGLLPEHRRYDIDRSANEVGLSFPCVTKQIWVNGEKTAYRLESMLHRHFQHKKVTLPEFDGYTEVFNISIEDCENYLECIKDTLDSFISRGYTDEYTHKLELSDYYISQSVEWCGSWYKSNSHLREVEGYTPSEFGLVSHYTDKVKADFRISRRRSAAPYDKFRFTEKQYGKDWGDGLFGTIRGLSRKYGHKDGTILHRVNVLGYSMKKALSLPIGNTDGLWNINGKWYLKKHVCELVGIKQHAITQRVRRGIPLKYALIPDRWGLTQVKDRIYILNGEAYWFADIKSLFGFKGKLSNIYLEGFTDLKHYLEYWGFLSETDRLEIIVF